MPSNRTAILTLRIPKEDIAHLDDLVEKLPGTNRAALARDALQRGLKEIEREFLKKP